MVAFGVEGILQAFKGSKPKPKINWYKVARAPQRAAASAHFKDRDPVRRGRSMRDLGDMVALLSDDCSDVTEQEIYSIATRLARKTRVTHVIGLLI